MKENLRDWYNHLVDTFVFLKENDSSPILPFYVQEVKDRDGEEVGVVPAASQFSIDEITLIGKRIYETRGEIKKSRTYGLAPGNKYQAFLDMPPLGMLSNDYYVLYVCYNNQRQFKKSLNRRIIECTSALLPELQEVGGVPELTLSDEAVWRAANNAHYHIDQAIDDIYMHKALGRSINNKFAIVAKLGISVPVVVYKQSAIGYVNKQSRLCIPQQFNYLHEELTKCVPPERVRYE